MKRFIEITSLVVFIVACTASCCAAVISENESVREERLLCDGWRFTREDSMSFARCDFDDSSWESVTVPHDWAIYGPFDRENDLQDVLVVESSGCGLCACRVLHKAWYCADCKGC